MTPSSEKPDRPDPIRAFEVDMSPEAIDQRLRELGQLYELGKTFRDVRYIGPIVPKHSKEELLQLLAEYEAKMTPVHPPAGDASEHAADKS